VLSCWPSCGDRPTVRPSGEGRPALGGVERWTDRGRRVGEASARRDGAVPQRLAPHPTATPLPRCSVTRARREGGGARRSASSCRGCLWEKEGRRRRSAPGGKETARGRPVAYRTRFWEKEEHWAKFGGLREVLKNFWAKFQSSHGPTWTTLWARHCPWR
jgi:hypothetical protein